MTPVAVLFARTDSVYKTLPGCDVWDIERDARLWPGGCPVVAHPPCRAWGRLRQFAKPRDDEKALAPWAVDRIRQFGGVLEHPAESSLWAHCCLPRPGRAPDDFGGWSMAVRQCDFGHRAEKLTWLYVVGLHPDELPQMPPELEPTGCIKPRLYEREHLPIVTKAEREHTPPEFAAWLVDLARRTRVASEVA